MQILAPPPVPGLPTVDLTPNSGLSLEALNRRLHQCLRLSDAYSLRVALDLYELKKTRKFSLAGSPSMRHFVIHQLQEDYERCKKAIQLGEKLTEEVPELLEAYAAGKIKLTAVRLLAFKANAQTVAAWIEWAATHSLEELKAHLVGREGKLPSELPKTGVKEPKTERVLRQSVLQAETFRRAKERTIARLKLPAEYSDTDFVDFLAQGELVAPRRPNDAALNEGHFFVPLGQTKQGQVVVRAGAEQLEPVRLAAALRSLKTTTSEQELVEIVQLGLAELKRRDSKFLSEEPVGAAPPAPALLEGLASEEAPGAGAPGEASPGEASLEPTPVGPPAEASPGTGAPERAPATLLAEASPGPGAGADVEASSAASLLAPAKIPARTPAAWTPPALAPIAPAVLPLRIQEEAPAVLDPRNAGPLVSLEQRVVGRLTDAQRREVIAIDVGCRHCGTLVTLQVHHIHWQSRGGSHDLRNLITLCVNCHSLVHRGLLMILGDREQLEIRSPLRLSPGPLPSITVDRELLRGPGLAQTPPDQASRAASSQSPEPSQAGLAGLAGSPLAPLAPLAPLGPLAPLAPLAPVAPGPDLSQLVGQERVRGSLDVAVRAAQLDRRPLSHVLLTGGSGQGKTSLARAAAKSLGARFVSVHGPSLKTVEALAAVIARVGPRGVLFVDELHSVPKGLLESLYQVLDELRLSLAADQPPLELAPFTLVAATTDDHGLPGPLLTRFKVLRLDRTAAPELAQIVTAAAEGQQLAISAEAAAVLAGAARQTPREAKRLLGAAIDEVRAAGRSEIAAADARQALEREGIDPDGLNPLDRELLAALAQARQGALGVRSLAAKVGAERASLLRHVEPFLIRQGLIEITPLGRRLTERGRARVGTVPRPAAGWPKAG